MLIDRGIFLVFELNWLNINLGILSLWFLFIVCEKLVKFNYGSIEIWIRFGCFFVVVNVLEKKVCILLFFFILIVCLENVLIDVCFLK